MTQGQFPAAPWLAPVAARAPGHPAGSATGTPARFYRPELDGLRFFAFFAVYMNHTIGFGSGGNHHHLPDWAGDVMGAMGYAGNFGVDLFFVLSSFLITQLLLRERELRGTLDIRAFYLRRILRIWPLYFFLVFSAYALTFVDPSEGLTWIHVLGFTFFAGNWVYFLLPVTTVAAPLWSVSLEEQFYLIWPWVIRRLPVRQIAFLAIGLMVLAIAVRFAMGLLHPDQDWVSKNSFTRIDGIAVGALVAIGCGNRVPDWSAGRRLALFAACLAVIAWVTMRFGLFHLPASGVPLMFGWTLAAVACGGILLSVLGADGPLTAFLRSRPAIYLGRISYGLYAYHEFVLKLGDYLFPLHNSSGLQMIEYWLLGLVGALALAAASYQWLEMPFLRLKRERYTIVESRSD